MTKRILTFALAAALLFLCLTPVFAETVLDNIMIMYVYTDNGKGLNVRSTPYVGDNIIGLAPYGTQIKVKRLLDNGWACIIWNVINEAYVQSRFLQWEKPDPYVPTAVTPTPTPMPTATPTATAVPYYPTNVPYYPTAAPYPTADPYSYYTDTLAVLNAEFRTARMVSPSFTIVVRPTRASGWVNMRWAPSKDVEVLGTYRYGAKLTVIAETQSWYQVIDPDTDATGFIMKSYTTRQY